MLLTDDSITSSFFKRSRISSSFFAMFAVISSAVRIVSSSAISPSVEMDFRDFLLSGEEVESSELVDILFLLFPSSSDMNSAICRYGDLGYREEIADSPNKRLYAAIARPSPPKRLTLGSLAPSSVELFSLFSEDESTSMLMLLLFTSLFLELSSLIQEYFALATVVYRSYHPQLTLKTGFFTEAITNCH